MVSKFGKIWPGSMESSAFSFGWIFIILAGNKDNYKSMDEFEFLPDPITNYWVSCPWAFEKWMYNVVSTLAPSFWIGSYSFLQATRAAMKAWMGLKFSKIEHGSMELAALECVKKNLHRPIGHRERIIYPSLTVYSASHNTCGASPYALSWSQNMNKGKKKEKNTFTRSFFNYCMLCNGCQILGKPRPGSN